MISKIEILLKSKASWTLAGIFIYSGLEAIVPQLGNGHFGQIIQAILAIMTLYMHPKEIQVAGATGMLGSTRIKNY